MKTIFTFMLIFTAFISDAQIYTIRLVFNNKTGGTSGTPVFRLTDITASDSLKAENPEIEILEYSVAGYCSLDWEYKSNSPDISETVKKYIENCVSGRKARIYFSRIKVRYRDKIYYPEDIDIIVLK